MTQSSQHDIATESEIEEELQPLIGKYVSLGCD
jgi:hypothetical protein